MKTIRSNERKQSIKYKKSIITLLIVSFCAFSGNAQFLKHLGKNVAERAVERGANKAADKVVDKQIDKAFEEKEKAEKGKNSAAETAEEKQEQITSYSKFDFIPGEQVLYAEDFVQDNIGELPLNWNSNANGVLVGVESPKGNWLKLSKGKYLSGSKLKTFGNDYTIEWDMILNVVSKSGYYLPPVLFGAFSSGTDANDDNKFLRDHRLVNAFEFKIDPNEKLNTAIEMRSYNANKETFRNDRKTLSAFGKTIRKVAHYALSIQGSRLRLWIDEVKVIDVPKAVNLGSPINQLFFGSETTGGYDDENYSYLISNIKVASGKPDTRSKLITEGKFVTSGILFDVNSDQIKPQSYAVLKEIGDALTANPDVKIKITGHTDSDGSAASNLTLSKKRAESVKKFLNTTFSIKEDRMETDGKGLTLPIADNKTPAGKASNRRVEFVKL
nr:OmpA family protein [Pedobacter panaciterrae]